MHLVWSRQAYPLSVRRVPCRLCSLHALPGFGQPFGQRGGPGRHGSARAAVSPIFNIPLNSPPHSPPILTATLRTVHGNWAKFNFTSFASWPICDLRGRGMQIFASNANGEEEGEDRKERRERREYGRGGGRRGGTRVGQQR